MKLIEVAPEELTLSKELTRTGSAKSFAERLQASIEEIGLAEPIKVAPLSDGGYLVIDGGLRLQAIRAIRKKEPTRFKRIPAYLFHYEQRFELRELREMHRRFFLAGHGLVDLVGSEREDRREDAHQAAQHLVHGRLSAAA